VPRKPTPNLSDAVAQYLGSRRNLATSTLLNDQAVLRKFARGVGIDREVGHLTPEQIEAHFRTLDGHRASSWNKARQRIGLFQVYGRNHGWVRGPDWFRDVPKRTVPAIERLRLSPIELVELPGLVQDPRDRALLAIAVNTGLRSGEIASLTIGDVDLDLAELYVYRSKSKRDDRLPITATLDRELRRWLTSYTEIVGPLDAKMLLVPGRHVPKYDAAVKGWGLGELNPRARIRKPHAVVQRALTAMNVETTWQEGLHTVRRSVGRAVFDHASASGHDSALRLTAALLGHKNVATTELYIGTDQDRRRRDDLLKAKDFLPSEQISAVTRLKSAR